MLNDIDFILEKIGILLSLQLQNIYYSYPLQTSSANCLQAPPRLVFAVEGKPVIKIGENQKVRDKTIDVSTCVVGLQGSETGISYTRQKCCTFAIVFYPKFIRLVFYDFCNQSGRSVVFYHLESENGQPEHVLMDQLVFFASRPKYKAAGLSLVRGMLQIFLVRLEQEKITSREQHLGKARETWLKIEDFIQTNLEGDLSRERVARMFRLNDSYLSFLCQQQTEMQYTQFVRQRRLEKAALLLDMNMPTEDILKECGFVYASHFIKCFRQKYGISPGAYRKRHF